jgi:hypothetical protein
VTTAAGYSSFSSNNSYSGKSSTVSTAGSSYLTSGTTVSSLSQYTASGDTTASQSKSSYDGSQSSAAGLGLSSVSSSKMATNTTQGNKLVPGMPPGVAGVLPAQYMAPAGFPAYLAAGLGQPAAAMYGYGGHQLEDLAALQRSTLAASLPQLVGNSTGAGQPGTAPANNAAVGQSAKGVSS